MEKFQRVYLTTRRSTFSLQYSNVCLSRQWASLYSDRFYF